jgi:hypothetical protein
MLQDVVAGVQREGESPAVVVVVHHGDPLVGDSEIAPPVASQTSIFLIVPKPEPVDTSLQPM